MDPTFYLLGKPSNHNSFLDLLEWLVANASARFELYALIGVNVYTTMLISVQGHYQGA